MGLRSSMRQDGRVRLAYRSELGHVRKRNEDAVLVPAPDVRAAEPWVVAVSDGMGGHPAGDVASEITVQTLAARLSRRTAPADLVEALLAAHKAIRVAAEAAPDKTGMGATAVVATVDSVHADIAHIGDSRAYLIRAGEARRLTEDHNSLGYLTQSLGHGAVSPDTITIDLGPGDRLLLCTDGLTGLVADPTIGDLAMADDPETACDRLVYAALDAGGHDNVTVVLVAI